MQLAIRNHAADAVTRCQHCFVADQQYLRYDAPARLIVASTVRRCEGPGARIANRLNWVSVANKLDYAHLHGFEFWLHTEQVPI